MECLADCGEGPVVIVDEKTYEDVQGERAEKFAEAVKNGELSCSKEFVSYEDALSKPKKQATATKKSPARKSSIRKK